MKTLDLTRWLLKVRDALAEQDEAKRNRMLLTADKFLRRNHQSLALRELGIEKFQRRESPNQITQPQRVVGLRARN
jgi:hypothetical protein